MASRKQKPRVAARVTMTVITQFDVPSAVEISMEYPAGDVRAILLSAHEMDALTEAWRKERATTTVVSGLTG